MECGLGEDGSILVGEPMLKFSVEQSVAPKPRAAQFLKSMSFAAAR